MRLHLASIAVCVFLCSRPVRADLVAPIEVTAGSTFTVDYNGYVGAEHTIVPGLSASATFSDFAFGSDTVSFQIRLVNTSGSPVTGSRVSVMGFEITPNIEKTGSTVTGAFDRVNVGKNMPTAAAAEFCLANTSNSCAGPDGVSQDAEGTAYVKLHFIAEVPPLFFDKLYVKYQSIEGVPGVTSAMGTAVSVPERSESIVLLTTAIMICGVFSRFASRRRSS